MAKLEGAAAIGQLPMGSRTIMCFARWSAIASLSGMLVTSPAAARDWSLTNSGDAHLWREQRSLEGRVDGASSGAVLQLERAQRDLIRQSRSVRLTPERARVDRGLDRVERELRPGQFMDSGRPSALPRVTSPTKGLRDGRPLPSMGDDALIGRLVGRARAAMAAGRTAQARSDLATARSLMTGVGPAEADVDPDRVLLQARLAKLAALVDRPRARARSHIARSSPD
jgi:hypothetical protein